MTVAPDGVFGLDRHGRRPLDRHADALERQAALLVDRRLGPALGDARIDDRDRIVLGVRLEHEHPAQHADLRRGQADPARVVHQRDHAVDQPLQVVVEVGDLVRLQPQRAVAVLADLRERELPSRLGLGVELVVVEVLAQRVVEHLAMRSARDAS